jgi:basic membrane protein A and related proteins
MRKLLIVTAVLLLAHFALLFAHPKGIAGNGRPNAARVGIVLDIGGLGDKSFNDGAWRGADSAIRLLGTNVSLIEPGEGADRESGLRLFAAEKMDLVMGIGFAFSDDLTRLAREYPNNSFAGIDFSVATDSAGNAIAPPPNLAALKFREEE